MTHDAPGPTPPGLSRRLAAIARFVPTAVGVVDVGSGHGRLPAWFALSGRAATTVATERDPAAAPGLQGLARRAGFELRFGDGLRALEPSDRAEVIVISGLGARSMLRILDSGGRLVRGADRLVLQPQTESGLLRRWLVEHAYEIVGERMVVDRGRSYVVIAAEPRSRVERPSHSALDFDDLMEAGPCLVRSGDASVAGYWAATRRRLERILARAGTGAERARASRGAALARRVLDALDGKTATD